MAEEKKPPAILWIDSEQRPSTRVVVVNSGGHAELRVEFVADWDAMRAPIWKSFDGGLPMKAMARALANAAPAERWPEWTRGSEARS